MTNGRSFNSGIWKSSFRPMSVSFNQNAWKLIPDSYDEEDGSLFGVIDPKDGSSFGIDVGCISKDEKYEYDGYESEYFSRLFNIDNETNELGRFNLVLDSIRFQSVLYSFKNRKFGRQIIIRGMYLGESEVIGISVAWPESTPLPDGYKVPPKFDIFFQNFVLRAE